mgnify:CR=1 FL=1
MTQKLHETDFNEAPGRVMHIDINSCFATIEQQTNPHLRGRPIVVAAYNSPRGCILAPSIEAKRFGIKTGMRVYEARLLYPGLEVLEPNPGKYRLVHLQFRKLLKEFTNEVVPKSIDEFVLNFKNYELVASDLIKVAKEIKQRIKKEIGDYITVSIGIAPNRFLAKTASNLKKPDGLWEINSKNFLDIYSKLKLIDLSGIDIRNKMRLNSIGINDVVDFYRADLLRLRAAFKSVNSYYWYLRLRGWEIDDFETERKSFGNSFALPYQTDLRPILQKLCVKTGARLRSGQYFARGVHLSLSFKDHTYWHQGKTLKKNIFDSSDIYKEASKILMTCPSEPRRSGVHILAVSVFNLTKKISSQLDLFADVLKNEQLVMATDRANQKWGEFAVTPARMFSTNLVKDRISFGGVREL